MVHEVPNEADRVAHRVEVIGVRALSVPTAAFVQQTVASDEKSMNRNILSLRRKLILPVSFNSRVSNVVPSVVELVKVLDVSHALLALLSRVAVVASGVVGEEVRELLIWFQFWPRRVDICFSCNL